LTSGDGKSDAHTISILETLSYVLLRQRTTEGLRLSSVCEFLSDRFDVESLLVLGDVLLQVFHEVYVLLGSLVELLEESLLGHDASVGEGRKAGDAIIRQLLLHSSSDQGVELTKEILGTHAGRDCSLSVFSLRDLERILDAGRDHVIKLLRYFRDDVESVNRGRRISNDLVGESTDLKPNG